MRNETLQSWLDKWGLIPTEGAKVLRINKSKMSEYLSEKSDRQPPPYLLAHIETFNLLTLSEAKKLIKKRLKDNLQ